MCVCLCVCVFVCVFIHMHASGLGFCRDSFLLYIYYISLIHSNRPEAAVAVVVAALSAVK